MELIIDKALKETDPEKKEGFAQSVAYYIKLAYGNWHKENVHDEAIRSELNAITNNQLAFSGAPIKYRANTGRDDQRGPKYGQQHSKQKSNNKNRTGGDKKIVVVAITMVGIEMDAIINSIKNAFK